MKKFNEITEVFISIKKMVTKIHITDKSYILLKVIMALVEAFISLPGIIVPGLLINELIITQNTWRIICYVILIIFTPFLHTIFTISIGKIIHKKRMNINAIFEADFYKHVSSCDMEMFERPDIVSIKNRSHGTLMNSLNIIDKLYSLLVSIVRLIAISSIIATLDISIVIIVMIVIAVNSLITKWLHKKQFEFQKKYERQSLYSWYLGNILTADLYAKEIRIFNLSSFFSKKYFKEKKKLNKSLIDNETSTYKAKIITSFVKLLQDVFAYALIITKVLKRNLGVGNMSIYLSAVSQFSGSINAIVKLYLDLVKDSYSINDLFTYLDMPQKQLNSGTLVPMWNSDSVIEFRNVSFKYPGSDSYALKNFNFTISYNEKICIVGENGSGKTTFIKLLTRIYWLEEGSILLNGISIYEYDYIEYMKLFSTLFQDFCLYPMTIKENVVLANDFNESLLDQIYKKSGAVEFIKKLPNGDKTQIFKNFDPEGVEPSGGECQRVAIAKALYHNGKIYILDEPTAALDPMAEEKIYTEFKNMIIDKCAILVTHRLSAVSLADRVAVFKGGQVVESGTHAELYAKGGIYTEMFDKQAQFYRDEAPATENAQEQ